MVEDSLKRLTVYSGGVLGAVWPALVADGVDLAGIVRSREMMKLALARYARQSLLQWADVRVTRIHRWYVRLVDMIGEENRMSSALEDG